MPKRAADGEASLPFASLFSGTPTDFTGGVEPDSFRQRLARRKFLRAIERHVPTFLAAVRRDVFPLFATAVTALDDTAAAPIPWLEIDRRSRIPESTAVFGAVRKAILNCAMQFNLVLRDAEGAVLPAAWACDVLALTVSSWLRVPAIAERSPRFPFEHDFPYGDWIENVQSRRYALELDQRGPNPHEAYGEFQKRILAAAKVQLKRDWSAAQGAGATTREKTEDQHFVWLALFQVAGASYPEIVAALRLPPNTEATVRQAMPSTVAALPLTLRTARRGRPRVPRRKPRKNRF